jgi:hypothetical protein
MNWYAGKWLSLRSRRRGIWNTMSDETYVTSSLKSHGMWVSRGVEAVLERTCRSLCRGQQQAPLSVMVSDCFMVSLRLHRGDVVSFVNLSGNQLMVRRILDVSRERVSKGLATVSNGQIPASGIIGHVVGVGRGGSARSVSDPRNISSPGCRSAVCCHHW